MPKMTSFLAWIISVGLHIVTLLGSRNRLATLINLTAKYLTRGSHNAIVGETPDVMADHPVLVEARRRRGHLRASRPASRRLLRPGVEGLERGNVLDDD